MYLSGTAILKFLTDHISGPKPHTTDLGNRPKNLTGIPLSDDFSIIIRTYPTSGVLTLTGRPGVEIGRGTIFVGLNEDLSDV